MSMYEDYAKLRKSIGVVQKSGENPHFKNTYVELNTAIEVVDAEIEKHGFVCFIQTPINIAGKNYLHTELIHKDGEKIIGDLELITTKQDPQMLGSSLTYARRYSLLTMLGLKAEDDDGNLTSGVTKPTEKKPSEAMKLFNDATAKKLSPDWNAIKAKHNVKTSEELTSKQIAEIRKELGL